MLPENEEENPSLLAAEIDSDHRGFQMVLITARFGSIVKRTLCIVNNIPACLQVKLACRVGKIVVRVRDEI